MIIAYAVYFEEMVPVVELIKVKTFFIYHMYDLPSML